MKTGLAYIGPVVLTLWLLGAFCVSYFVHQQDTDEITCTKGTT